MTRRDIRVGQIYRWNNSYDENDGRYEVVSIGELTILFKRCSDNSIINDEYPISSLIECVDGNNCVLESEPSGWNLSKFRFV